MSTEYSKESEVIKNPVADDRPRLDPYDKDFQFQLEEEAPTKPISPLIKCLLFGFGLSSLLPWNMIINAAGFFSARLTDTPFYSSFPNYIQAVGVICNLAGSAANVPLSRRFDIRKLAVASNLMLGGSIGAICILSAVDTGTWAVAFFCIALVFMVINALGHSVQTSSMNAIITMTEPSLTVWYYFGKGTAGFVAVIISVATLSFPGIDVETAAFWYFLVTFIIVFFIVSYLEYRFIMLPEIVRVVKGKQGASSNGPATTETNKSAAVDEGPQNLSTLELAKIGWRMCLCAFINSFITLSIYPALSTNMKEYDPNAGSDWSDKYYLPVSIFLVFSVGDCVGKMLAGVLRYPSKTQLLPVILARLILLPLVIMCNIKPRTIPVWFRNDIFPSVFIFITAITGGHCLNLTLMYTPTYVSGPQNKGRLGTITYLMVAAGMGTASCAIFAYSALINV